MKTIIQFGYTIHSPPVGGPLVDCRSLSNPHRIADHARQRQIVRESSGFWGKVEEVKNYLKDHDTVGVGCAYGVHRSGVVVEEVLRAVSDVVVVKLNPKA